VEEAIVRDPSLFADNLKKAGLADRTEVKNPLKEWEFCMTDEGRELNLRKVGTPQTLHFPKGIQTETNYWIHSFAKEGFQLLVVYGVGLGYYYKALKSWLSENPERIVHFVEKDPELMHAFLETNAAAELLEDPQAFLSYIGDEIEWHQRIKPFVRATDCHRREITASLYYQKEHAKDSHLFKITHDLFYFSESQEEAELFRWGSFYFNALFKNFLRLPDCNPGLGLKGKFKGVPAVICGAGPSLEKQKELLHSVKDKALIFAGGSAMNALNVMGIIPHFGAGLDPFEAQISRIMENNAFMVPYFFRDRMNPEALEALSGDLLFIPLEMHYLIANWMQEEAKLDRSYEVESGSGVMHFSVALAEMLGCSPILVVGMDLSYTHGQTYSKGVQVHATFNPSENLLTKHANDEPLLIKDIHGNFVYTIPKWYFESIWYGEFVQRHPHVKLINCTEGGIGLANIPNQTFKEAVQQLSPLGDLDGRLSAELSLLYDAYRPSFEETKEIEMKLYHMIQEIFKDPHQCSDEMIKENKPLRLLLEPFLTILKKSPEEEKLLVDIRGRFVPSKSRVISLVLEQCILKISEALTKAVQEEEFLNREPYIETPSGKAVGEYHYQNGLLTMEDAALGIHVKEPLDDKEWDPITKTGWKRVHSELGNLLEESYYLSDLLHGPSRHFAESGALLCETWYLKGRREGVQKTYFLSGGVYSLKGYKAGLNEGVHAYFYPNGILRAEIPFKQGLFEGASKIYYRNGRLKREVHYDNGLRQGADLYYQANGNLRSEAYYFAQKPYGTAKVWNQAGILRKEIVYFTPGVIYRETYYDDKGNRLPEKEQTSDFYDVIVQKNEMLHKTIQLLANRLERLFSDSQGDEQKDFQLLRDEVKNLGKLSEAIKFETGRKAGEFKEPIGNSPKNKEEIQRSIDEITEPMKDMIQGIQEQLMKLQKKMNREDG
jgi:antitoxin component YwqK of YwqJK toxin-antitoxin module